MPRGRKKTTVPEVSDVPNVVVGPTKITNLKTTTPLFEGMVFTLNGKKFQHDNIEQFLKDHGAVVVKNLTKKVTHLLNDYNYQDPNITQKASTKLTNAIKNNNITIVDEQWIDSKIVANNNTSSDVIIPVTTTNTIVTAATPTKRQRPAASVSPSPVQRRKAARQDVQSDLSFPSNSTEEEESTEEEVQPVKKKTAAKARSQTKGSSNKQTTTKAATTKAATTKVESSRILVDPSYRNSANASVHKDYDCMLNQVNIGSNNNKFYKIQLIYDNGSYILFTRWGRVGETGMTQCKSFSDATSGERAFASQFRSKTKNAWEQRHNFVKHSGKYMLVQTDNSEKAIAKVDAIKAKYDEYDDDDEEEKELAKVPVKIMDSQLPVKTRDLIELIFSDEMFHHTMSELKVDTKRLPLGSLTRAGIEAGMDALAELEKEIQAGATDRRRLQDLCSTFYTLIPHAFPRSVVPPLITTKEELQNKFDMLNIMLDIENAQEMKKGAKKPAKKKTTKKKQANPTVEMKPNPIDEKYNTLKSDLNLLDPKSKEFTIVSTYANQTMSSYHKVKLMDVWEVNRHDEDQRFAKYDFITNRRLLWHGTKCAVVASCLEGGLRIMPHSGGRVGKGIYLASEHGKSVNYTWPGKKGGKQIGIMFLVEAALGTEHHIVRDDPTLKSAPPGCHSIVALGHKEPDPKKDVTILLDSKPVVVPQGPPIPMSRGNGSNFDQTEYLIYDEAQHRIRFVCTFEF